jgi:hypothetical protein
VPAVHDCEAVGHRQRLLLVVRDVEEGDSDLLLERLQLDLQRLAELRVEGSERLVEEQHGRVEDERPSQSDALLLAAGELRGLAPLVSRELHELERLSDALADLGLRPLRPLQAEGDVVEDVQVREEGVVLEDGVHVAVVRRRVRDVGAVQENLTGGRLLEAGDHAQGRGLPAPGRPEQREELAARHVQVDAVDSGHLGELLRQLAQFDFAACHWSPDAR